MKKITIWDIAITGMALAILTVVKFLDVVMPKIGTFPIIEFWFPVAMIFVMLLPFKNSLLLCITAPFLWLAVGQVQIQGPLSFVMDYELSILMAMILLLNTNRVSISNGIWISFLIIVASISKALIQSASGVVNWNTPFEASAIINFPFNMTTMAFSIPFILLIAPKLYYIRRTAMHNEGTFHHKNFAFDEFLAHKPGIKEWQIIWVFKIHDGYTNISYKFITTKGKFQVRIPKQDFVDWDNEVRVYEEVERPVVITPNGVLIKPWINGKNLYGFNEFQELSLMTQVENFHQIEIQGAPKWDWLKYHHHFNKIDDVLTRWFEIAYNKYKDDKLVFSHTDINYGNMLVQGNEVTLIDFEWACYAPEYLDWAVIYSTTEILNKSLDKEKLEDYAKMYEIFSLAWTYEMEENNELVLLRDRLKNKLLP